MQLSSLEISKASYKEFIAAYHTEYAAVMQKKAELLAFLLAKLAVEQAALVTAVWQYEFVAGLESSHRIDPKIVTLLFPRASASELFNPELFAKGIEFRALILSLIPRKSELLREDYMDHLKRFIQIAVADTIQRDPTPATA